jgi:hypothetical protein
MWDIPARVDAGGRAFQGSQRAPWGDQGARCPLPLRQSNRASRAKLRPPLDLKTAKALGLDIPASVLRAETQSGDMQEAAHALGLQIHIVNASTEGEIDSAFATLARLRAGALIVGTREFFNSRPEQLAELAARHAMPAFYQLRQFAAAGGQKIFARVGNPTQGQRVQSSGDRGSHLA